MLLALKVGSGLLLAIAVHVTEANKYILSVRSHDKNIF